MAKKAYSKPVVTAHEKIVFETALSNCICVYDYGTYKICVKPDNTWEQIP